MAASQEARDTQPDPNEGVVPSRPPAEGGREQVDAALDQQDAKQAKSEGSGRDDGAVAVEPDNSTVNDWHGQKVADDMEMVDEVLEETGGDEDAAERAFDERSAQNDPERDINRPKPAAE
jgi:hypothetical protein